MFGMTDESIAVLLLCTLVGLVGFRLGRGAKIRFRKEFQTEWDKRYLGTKLHRIYGRDGTIHGTHYLDVETVGSEVIAVWFRCQLLPFKQVPKGADRKEAIFGSLVRPLPLIHSLELEDQPGIPDPELP